MTETIDGLPVTHVSAHFGGTIEDKTGQIRAGEVMPMVVLVVVDSLSHRPLKDDTFERINEVVVTHMAPPASPEMYEQLLGMIRAADATAPALSLAWSSDDATVLKFPSDVAKAVAAVVDELTPVQPANAPAQLEDDVRVRGGFASADSESVDDDDDFELPPPAPDPVGQVTRRQIVPGDSHLRSFLEER